MPQLLWPGAPLGQRRTRGRWRGGAREVVARAADAIIAVTLAPSCAACQTPLDRPNESCVCRACWKQAAATPSIFWFSALVTAARAGGSFDGALRDIIHAFKYEGRRSLAVPLARLMRDAGADVLNGADAVVPVPLHPWRRFRRGFNQAHDLARRLDLPVMHAIWRIHATAPQSGLSGATRRRNVPGAFAMSPWLVHGGRQRQIRDRVVVIVDDVRTTGATLNACAEVLKKAGAREVRALTAAARDKPTA